MGCGLPNNINEAAQQEEGSAARRPRSKKGRRRGGAAARRRVAGEEVELPVSSSEGLNLENMEEQWKCGFWWEVGRGGEIDISVVAETFHSVLRQTGMQVWFKRGRWTVDDEASCISQTRRYAKIFYITSHTILSSKLFVVYLIFFIMF